MSLGPFDIGADQIKALGARFTPFVNRLLDLEAKAHGLKGHLLTITTEEHTADGGVDAALCGIIEPPAAKGIGAGGGRRPISSPPLGVSANIHELHG